MPNYKGHLVGGCGAFGIILLCISAHIPSLFTVLEWLVCILLGSLFPDIDTTSKGRKIFYRIVIILAVILLLQQRFKTLLLLGFAALLPMLVRHRGLFHSLWFNFFLTFMVICYTAICAPKYCTVVVYDIIFFLAGVISHLWLDLGFKRMIRIK